MSVNEEKTFVMKHVFTNVENMKISESRRGPKEYYVGVPWQLAVFRLKESFEAALICQGAKSDEEWSIETTVNTKILAKDGEEKVSERKNVFGRDDAPLLLLRPFRSHFADFLVDGNVNIVECKVTIHKMSRLETPRRFFNICDDKSAKEISNIELKVKNQKFHVNKMYLLGRPTLFKSLFLGNFEDSQQSALKDIEPKDIALKIDDQNFYGSQVYLTPQSSHYKSLHFGNLEESKQSEIEDIKAENFQKFLEILYGEAVVDEDNVKDILKLAADMYCDATVIRQCEDFLIFKSEKDSKRKFNMALKYDMDQLKKKCISELKSVEDLEKIIPEDRTYLDKETSNQLLDLAISLHKAK